jgi:hypothetical protein
MPFKANADRRHHVPKRKRKVTNWAAHDASPRQRGSLTVWFPEEAIVAWRAAPRMTRGGQRWYSALAILRALTLRAVFRLSLRQTEGLIGSRIDLLGLTLARVRGLEAHAGTVQRLGGSHRFDNDQRWSVTTTKRPVLCKTQRICGNQASKGTVSYIGFVAIPPISGHSPAPCSKHTSLSCLQCRSGLSSIHTAYKTG